MPYVADLNLGWNAGARSLKVCFGDCQLRFSAPASNAGLCIGFNTSDRDAGFREIRYAFFLQNTTSGPKVFVYESGAQVHAGETYETTDIFTIRRNGTQVTYYQNDTLLYTSATPITGGLFVDSSLYAGGDSV
jgi:hypothetical protein